MASARCARSWWAIWTGTWRRTAPRSRSWLPSRKAAASCRTSTGSRYAVGCFRPKCQHLLGECRRWALIGLCLWVKFAISASGVESTGIFLEVPCWPQWSHREENEQVWVGSSPGQGGWQGQEFWQKSLSSTRLVCPRSACTHPDRAAVSLTV